MESRFCEGCQRKIIEGTFGFGKEKFFEFKNGVYCEKCAKLKVDKSRGKM